MDAAKLQLKIFTAPGSDIPSEEFIPVLHTFIKHQKLPELLIDVANYTHVPRGPGVVLIGHGTDYFIDESVGRQGLLFNRKRQAPPPAERLQDTFARALHAAVVLEGEPALAGKLKFATDELMFRINDRLMAPNNDGTMESVRGELEAFCTRLFGAAGFSLTRVGHARELFAVSIKINQPAPLATLLERVGGAPKAAQAAA